ncbi:uncharacterized protein TDEL_0F05580 [Torulaspora delbrueckii]|uniref:VPS10 domain-containing protein n=1 Tax=Torulaspora delbrueckii TaxID=4950 RepID=G8ZXM5_TORDE|nr:hypothetical protein TDEL_0F05580 [Torulaspora delbrueckii]CCE93369.1 hypothetical protein TDEL_0F05580 [Torulaspora delbrueckii]
MHLIGVVCALFAVVCYGEQFQPKVTKVTGDGSYNLQAFDDSTTLLRSVNDEISISSDNGVTWKTLKDVKSHLAHIDPFHSHTRAFAPSSEDLGTIYYTDDMGNSWDEMTIEVPPDMVVETFPCEILTHPKEKDYLIAKCWVCNKEFTHCARTSYISTDCGKEFRSVDEEFTADVDCKFAFDKSVICLQTQAGTSAVQSKLLYTEDLGVSFSEYKDFKGSMVSSFEVLDSWIVAFTLADKFNRDSNKNLWVSYDGKSFKKAYMPTQLRNADLSNVFEDSFGKIFLPIINSGRASEVLVSDSKGLKFSPLTWRNIGGGTRIAQLKYLKGTLLAEFYELMHKQMKVIPSETKISFDGGYSWQNLKVVDPDNKDKYSCDIEDVENCSLHTVTEFHESNVPTPGIMMKKGYVSDDSNRNFDDMAMFITTDGGHSWRKTLDFPAVFAYGDFGNVLVACPINPDSDGDPQSEIYYSLDQGNTWTEYHLKSPLVPDELFSTTPDGSGVNFVLRGEQPGSWSKKAKSILYAIDFNEVFDGAKCKDDDLEDFLVAKGECINGAKYKFSRRRADAECLIRQPFVDLESKEEICPQCTEKDYECAFEFSRTSDNKCEPDYMLLALSEKCKETSQKNLEMEPMQVTKNNKCLRKLDILPVKVNCKPQSEGADITVKENQFDSNIIFYQYFETIADETVLIGTIKSDVYVSHDSGQTIKKFNTDEKIIEVIFNPYFNSSAYLFGASGTLYFTKDRGYSFHETKLPRSRQLGFPLEFSAKDENTFIYYGGRDCDSMFNPECHAVAYITTDGGRTFEELLNNAIHCEFVGSLYEYPSDEKLIFCQVKEKNSQKRTLVATTDFFVNDKTVLFGSIIGYMSTGEFTVVAIPHDNGELRAYVTVDGKEFAEAKFPQDATAERQEAFTILGSQTGSIFLHLSTNNRPGGEFGVLMKSNSNGTSFVTLERAVNRNQQGMVDFEKVQGLEGIIMVNTVGNRDEVLNAGEGKKLKSKITFNDGSDWSFVQPPQKDCEGKSYSCSESLEKCSLHLHSYSERTDIRDTSSSGSAIGMLIGVGNVGEYLLPKDECSTFFSSDGGESWTEIKKGPYQWEYGDHGGILVLVPENVATDTLTYSTDAGKSWNDYKFTEQKTVVQDIITVPGDSVLRFLLISQSTSVKGGSTKTFSIDFTGSFARQCTFNRDDPATDDFDYLSLGDFGSECLFGHQAEYLKKINHDCYVGNVPVSEFHRITKNCSCTRKDFECDYNFQKANDGTCKLVEGLTPAGPTDICKKSDAIEFYEPSGYRKIPLSTCAGGLKLDTASDPQPCPGKEDEFKKIHIVRGFPFLSLFFVFFAIFVLVAWFVYIRGIRRNGGFARFGEIRLGDESLIENNATDKAVNFVVRSGLYAVSGLLGGYQLAKSSASKAVVNLSEKFGKKAGPTYSSLLHDQFLDDANDLLEGHDEDANDLGSFLENEGNFEIDDEENPSNPSDTATRQPYSEDVASAPEVDTTNDSDEDN